MKKILDTIFARKNSEAVKRGWDVWGRYTYTYTAMLGAPLMGF